jgi:hypothetical protein
VKIRMLIAGTAAFALAGATGASALVSTDATKVTVTGKTATGGGGGKGGTGGKRETYGTQSLACEDGNTVVYSGPLEMWPPNHKYRNLSVVATDDESENTVTLITTGTHDEFAQDGTEMNGAGNTDDDFFDVTPGGMDSGTGSAQTDHQIRGERSGRGDGRTYTIHSIATFSDGERCEGDFTSTVPHDQGNGGGRPNRSAKRKSARR